MKTVSILTWCGLRGAISIALAMSVPEFIQGSSHIYTTTYVLVVFSIFVQGLFCNKMMHILCTGLQHLSFFDTVFLHVPQLKPLPQTKEILSSISPSRRYNENISFLSPLTPQEGRHYLSATRKEDLFHAHSPDFSPAMATPSSKKSLLSKLSTSVLSFTRNDNEDQRLSLEETPPAPTIPYQSSPHFVGEKSNVSTETTPIKQLDTIPITNKIICQDEQENMYVVREYSLSHEETTPEKLFNNAPEVYPLLQSSSSRRPNKRKQGTYHSTQNLPPRFPH